MRFLGNVLSGASSSPRPSASESEGRRVGRLAKIWKRRRGEPLCGENGRHRSTGSTASTTPQSPSRSSSRRPPSRPLLRSFFAADDFFSFLSPFPGQLTNGMFSVSACDVHWPNEEIDRRRRLTRRPPRAERRRSSGKPCAPRMSPHSHVRKSILISAVRGTMMPKNYDEPGMTSASLRSRRNILCNRMAMVACGFGRD